MNAMLNLPDVLPLPGWSTDHVRQRARFLSSCLRQMLAHRFQARLAGSWATNEAHLPCPVEDQIFSLSDVDVLLDELPTSDNSAAIINSVLILARQHGVEISKVSVRCRSEIDAFWNPNQISVHAGNKWESGRFLTFWALIGAIEAFSLSPADSASDARDYNFIKFFFKICRNVLLLRRCVPGSYRDLTTEAFTQMIPHPGVLRAYAIKVGHEATLSSSDCEAMLSDSNWEPLTGALIDTQSSDSLADIRKDIRTWYRTGAPPLVESYLAQIKMFEERPELLPACAKVVRDYEYRIVNGAS